MTAWVPLGDVPLTHGPLAVLAGSSAAGLLRHYPNDEIGLEGGAGHHGVLVAELEEAGCVWRSADFQAGDVLLFNSLCIHSALPNLSQEIRLSADYRFSGVSKEVAKDSLLPHLWGLTWEEIYEGARAKGPWSSERHQYYWRDDAVRGRVQVIEKVDALQFAASPNGFGLGSACPNTVLPAEELEAALLGEGAPQQWTASERLAPKL